MEVLKVLHATQDKRVLWLSVLKAFACKTKYKGSKRFELLNKKSVWNKLEASSKEAQRQLGGSMKQAGSMFEASCRNRNANSRKLAGSLNKPEGNTEQA